jgi:OOP family OmpA-OmpF porin
LAGLRDPLAADPKELTRRHRIDPRPINAHWKEYISLEPPLIEARARQILKAPAGMEFTFHEGVVSARGAVEHTWIVRARKLGQAIIGATKLDLSHIADIDIAAQQQAIESETVPFDVGVSSPRADSMAQLQRLASAVKKLEVLANEDGIRESILVFGHSDHTGIERTNVLLARQRAERTAFALEKLGVNRGVIVANGGVGDGIRAATFRLQVSQSPEDH